MGLLSGINAMVMVGDGRRGVDLRDFGSWISGVPPWDLRSMGEKRKKRLHTKCFTCRYTAYGNMCPNLGDHNLVSQEGILRAAVASVFTPLGM